MAEVLRDSGRVATLRPHLVGNDDPCRRASIATDILRATRVVPATHLIPAAHVIPVKAGISIFAHVIPAFVGMT